MQRHSDDEKPLWKTLLAFGFRAIETCSFLAKRAGKQVFVGSCSPTVKCWQESGSTFAHGWRRS